MYQKLHKGQGVVWVILIIAIVAIIVLWMSKQPSSISRTSAPESTESAVPSSTQSNTPTVSKSLNEIDQDLKDLNNSAVNIDNGINDTQLDITQ